MQLLRERQLAKAPDHKERALHYQVAMQFAGTELPAYLVAVEWHAPKNYRGDLVFCDENHVAVVVEVKHIHMNATLSDKHKRKSKVIQQAMLYRDKWQQCHENHFVLAATYTNLDGLRFLSL